MKNVSKKCLSGIIVLSSVILPIQAATMPTYAESQVVMNTSSETTNLIKVEAKDATCTTDGNITYWTNSDHNKFFSDEDGKNEISQEATIVKATGHKWNEEYTVDQKATATTKGQKSIRCSVCNEIKPGSEVEFSLGWEEIEDHWYYFDEDGKKVVSQWIGDYYVDEEGIMAADTWIGNDHVNKYGLKDDTAGWKHDGKGWWYLNAGGGYPKSTWKQVDGTWYYFNDKGYMFTGWLKQGATWYYLKPNGAMAKGWDYIGNKWYYFTEDGFMKASSWIDDLYYVKADGSMAANEYVQGYWLDKNGKWSYKPRASWKKNSKGWWYEDTTGWYPRNATYIIDGKRCVFDVNGYLWDLTQANNVLNKIGRNLRAAYNWSASLTYWRQSYSPNMGTRWYANIGFTLHKGNCYVMAGTFTEMARALGYNAHQVVGYVPHRGGGDAPHSWVEIDEADGTWVYDPNLTNEKGLPAFHFKYGKAKTWRYYKYHRVN